MTASRTLPRFILLTSLLAVCVLAAFAEAVPARAQFCDDTYIVQPGDTLGSIAEECGLDYIVLVNINYEISDPNLIRPGQVIRLTAEIPLYTTPASGPAQDLGLQDGGSLYVVRKGDSLARIAYLYNTTVYEIFEVNPQLHWTPVIYPGQQLRMPADAKKKKGWVGVSDLTLEAYDEFEVRLVDFTPYATVEYRLHQKFTWEDDDEFFDPTLFSEIWEGSTDANGSGRITLRMPYWAYEDEIWVVDVVVLEEGDQAVPVSSPDITIE